jgi:hypothetical protein
MHGVSVIFFSLLHATFLCCPFSSQHPHARTDVLHQNCRMNTHLWSIFQSLTLYSSSPETFSSNKMAQAQPIVSKVGEPLPGFEHLAEISTPSDSFACRASGTSGNNNQATIDVDDNGAIADNLVVAVYCGIDIKVNKPNVSQQRITEDNHCDNPKECKQQ